MAKLWKLVAVVGAGLGVFALMVPASSANELKAVTINCTEVSGSFIDFVPVDHPIVWHVRVGNGAFQALPTTETPPGFIGSGTASADISALTSNLNGATVTVEAFATWVAHTSATTSESVTCGTAPTTTTAPPTTTTTIPIQVSPEVVVAVQTQPAFAG